MTVETGPYQLHLQPKADAPLPVKITYISAPRLQGNPPILCLWYPINLLSHCVSNFSTSSWNYTSVCECGKIHQLHYSLGFQSELSFWCCLLNYPRCPVLDFTGQVHSPHVALSCLPCWVPGLELHLFGKGIWKNIKDRFTVLLAW